MTSPLRGKYLVRNRYLNFALRCADVLLNVARVRTTRLPTPPILPRRILLANGAHLGDVLIFSAVLPVLKREFPQIEIGVVVGSWANHIVTGHPLIQWVHVVDHWKHNRSGNSFLQKLLHYVRTRSRALAEIREVRYDVVIDFYYYFPNFIPMLWQAGIPIRIGYGSGGFGSLLTHEVEWRNRDCHVVDYHAALLRLLAVSEQSLHGLSPVLPPTSGDLEHRLESMIAAVDGGPCAYIVLHMGTGQIQREWPLTNWKRLAERLAEDGIRLVFTGTGADEAKKIASVIDGLQNCVDLCGKLSWPEFVTVVAGARLLVGVESLAGHLAAAVNTPCVFIKSGITHPLHWRPLTDQCEVLTATVSCSPCYRSNGCVAMDCVRGVEPNFVYEACNKLITEIACK